MDEIEVLYTGPTPKYARPGDGGADLASTERVVLQPGERRLVATGLAIALPFGSVGMVVPRSGLAVRSGLSIVNSPGIIDAGYRGEIKVALINLDRELPIDIEVGDRIAQLVVLNLPQVDFVEVEALPGSDRGERGFGSTGISSDATTQNGATR